MPSPEFDVTPCLPRWESNHQVDGCQVSVLYFGDAVLRVGMREEEEIDVSHSRGPVLS